MKKLIVFVIAAIASMIFFTGCGDLNKVDYTIRELDNRIERMYTDSGWNDGDGGRVYYRDTVTDVVYVMVRDSIAPLLHEDGTPYLWSEIEGGE